MNKKIRRKTNNLLKNWIIGVSVFFIILSLDSIFIMIYHTYFQNKYMLYTKDEYQLVDLEESTSSFIRNYEKVDRIKQFYNEMINSENYDYLEGIIQPVSIEEFKGDTIFYDEYAIENRKSTSEKRVKQVLLNDKIIEHTSLVDRIETGRIFNETDYIKTEKNSIPVILGANYKEYYSIGEKLKARQMLGIKVEYEIIGFLKVDSSIVVRNHYISLDSYIITPAYKVENNPKNMEELMYQGFFYLQKVNGTVKLKNGYSLVEFIQHLEKIRMKYNLFQIEILNVSMLATNLVKLMVYENIKMFILLSLGMLFFTIITMIFAFIMMLNADIYRYRVYLVCGYSMSIIKKEIWILLLKLLGIPTLLSWIISSTCLSDYSLLLFCFQSVLFTILYGVSFFVIQKYFKRMTVEKILKGENYD